MSVFGSPDPGRSHRGHRTIRATFLATVLIPVASMLVIWGLLVAGVLSGAIGGSGAPGQHQRDLAGVLGVAGTGLVVILVSVALMGLFTRRIGADIGGLAGTAEHLAGEELPQLAEKLRRGEPVTAGEAQPVPRAATAEVRQAAAAVASLARSAESAAAAEAGLRNGIGPVIISLARRNQSLLHRQLRLIDALERQAPGPATLADLIPLRHLTIRMRRRAEDLIIMSGAAPGRTGSEPVPVTDVIRGAVAEIEDYQRVSVLTRSGDAVAGRAVPDLVHLLAELIENATLSSPAGTRVEVRVQRVADGLAIEVDDHGLGIEARQLAAINAQLASPPDFDLANADQLGLFVVGKLAARHGVRVALRVSTYGGTTAAVLLPDNLVLPLNMAGAVPQPEFRPAPPPAGAAARPRLASGITAADAGFPPGPRPSPEPAGRGSLSSRSPGSRRPTPRPAGPGSGTAGAPGGSDTAAGAQGQAAAGPQPDTGTYRGLPRRVRQASLNPHLRQRPPAPDHAPPAARPAPAASRSPDEARRLASSLQRGWQRGRAAEPAAGQPATGPAAAATGERAARDDPDGPLAGEA
jgi:signal transduction histidine kinase